MNEKLYEVIVSGNYFTHSIGKFYDENILFKLESVFKLQGLFSKYKLRSMGIIVEGMINGNIRITKDNYVSLFDPSSVNVEKRIKSLKLNSYFPISCDDVIFLVDNSVEFVSGAKRSDFDWHEVIVKDKIPIDYIFGIVIPNVNEFAPIISSLLDLYGNEMLIYDFEGNLVNFKEKLR